MSDTKRCKGCSDQSGQDVSHPIDAFRMQKAHTGKYYPAATCIETERKMTREKKKARYATEEGRMTILANNGKYLTKPGVKEKRAADAKQRYHEDEDHRLDKISRQREYNDAHREEKKARAAAYFQDNKEKIYKRIKENQKNDIRLSLRGVIRASIWRSLNSVGASKAGASTLNHLGYTLDELKSDLENKFEDWMSWDNIGTKPEPRSWQIDHIVPQKYFPFDSMNSENFRLCWSLKNLRPLDHETNARDGDRLHLFGDFSSFQDIQDSVIRYIENPTSTESVDQIVHAAARTTPNAVNCPMSNTGLKYLDSLFKDRFLANSKNKKPLLDAARDSNALLDVLIHLVKSETPITEHSVVTNLKFTQRTPGHFFPMAAQFIVQKYAAGGDVYDPFVGWGGRCLGSILAHVDSYTGTDLQPGVIQAANTLSKDFQNYSKTKVFVSCRDALEFMRCDSKKYDLIFSSPPYSDTEDYNISSASMAEDWIDVFVMPFVFHCKQRLKPGGHVALHLKDIKGAPVYTAYHTALITSGFTKTNFHIYGRNLKQGIHVYKLI